MFKKILALFVITAIALSATPSVFASSDHEHECKADSDCKDGGHCKDGHCHE